jgi:nitrogen fixation NifU-like protein
MSELNDLYQEVILDHSRHPHNYGAMADATRRAEGYNPLCGDQLTLYLKLDGDRIQDIRFEGHGCAISKSSASVMTDIVKGKSKTEAAALFEKFRQLVMDPAAVKIDESDKMSIFSGISEFPTRVKCAVLGWHTLRSALENKDGKISTEGL